MITKRKETKFTKSVPISLEVQVGMDKHLACYKQEESKQPYPPAVKRLTLIQDCADEQDVPLYSVHTKK